MTTTTVEAITLTRRDVAHLRARLARVNELLAELQTTTSDPGRFDRVMRDYHDEQAQVVGYMQAVLQLGTSGRSA